MFNLLSRISKSYPGQSELFWVRLVLLSIMTMGVFLVVILLVNLINVNKKS